MASRTIESSAQPLLSATVATGAAEDAPLLQAKPGDQPENNKDSAVGGGPRFMGGISVARFWAIFAVICLTFGISCFDMTIMASTHPVITSYFHSANAASWLSTAFILTSTSCQPMMGKFSDTVGRKAPYVCGLLLFSVATTWCALAQSMMSFILARALCGVGAGVTMAMGGIMMSDMVPIEVRGIYQAYINIIYGVGSVMGAATGGLMTEYLGWRWTFGIQVPILLVCLVMATLVIPRDIGKSKSDETESTLESMKQFDFTGSLLLTSFLAFLILGLVCRSSLLPKVAGALLTSLARTLAGTYIHGCTLSSSHRFASPRCWAQRSCSTRSTTRGPSSRWTSSSASRI